MSTSRDETGLECPECGCREFTVDHTRKVAKKIIRYRRCRNCGKRITTYERVDVVT